MKSFNSSEEKLIKGLKNKKNKAFHQLYMKYAKQMRFICYRYVQDQEELNDVIQESFIKIYDKINQYRGNGSFEGWLKRLFINTAIDYTKRKRGQNESSIENDLNYAIYQENDDINELNIDIDVNHISQDQLLKMIKALPEHFRIVFNLHVIEGYNHKEIAHLLNINENTSKTRLLRAKTKLKKMLQKHAAVNMPKAYDN